MRYILGTLVAMTTLLLAAGCGTDGGSTADEPSPTRSAPAAPELVAILSQTAAGGATTQEAVDLGSTVGLDRLLEGVSRGGLDEQVRDRVAATDVGDGQRLMGSVISIGCDVPVDVKVFQDAGDVRLEPIFMGKPMQECLAAVTSVALVLVAT